jgi:hypothetical protein
MHTSVRTWMITCTSLCGRYRLTQPYIYTHTYMHLCVRVSLVPRRLGLTAPTAGSVQEAAPAIFRCIHMHAHTYDRSMRPEPDDRTPIPHKIHTVMWAVSVASSSSVSLSSASRSCCRSRTSCGRVYTLCNLAHAHQKLFSHKRKISNSLKSLKRSFPCGAFFRDINTTDIEPAMRMCDFIGVRIYVCSGVHVCLHAGMLSS